MPGRTYEFADFRLDAARRQLLRGNDAVSLTPKVFDTLLYLVEHAGRVVEKEELIRALWPDTIVEENNLTQNISHLRRILAPSPNADRCIATIPGRGYRFTAGVRSRTVPAAHALAVLPFKPLVAADRDEALELGMAATLIAHLSSSRNTVVRPLTSIRKYTTLDQDPLAAARELEAHSVLDGSIQRSGKQIRVNARLINVADGASLWAQTFDEEFTDVFAVQDTISQRVAAALALRSSTDPKRYTGNVEAYHLYLKGWYYLGKATPPDIRKGIEFFNQAIDIDPVYALAHAGIAEAYRRLPMTCDMPPKEAFPRARAAALKALEIDQALAEAHMSLGFIQLWFDRDWSAAETSMRRAVQLNPSSGVSHMGYMVLLTSLGRFQQAIVEGQRTVEFDPLAPIMNATVGWSLYCAGHDREARRQIDKTLELDPNFWIALLFSGRLHLKNREFPEAIAALTKARETSRGNSETIALLGCTYAAAGQPAQARAILAELESLATPHPSPPRYVPPHNIATLYNALGDQTQALRWLEKAYTDHDVRLAYLNVDPNWNTFRSDPRFTAFLQKLGF